MQFNVLCQDSLAWLSEQEDHSVPNFITGIPDLNELGKDQSLDTYLPFFKNAAGLMFQKVMRNGYCIFVQTDRKYDGQLVDKSYLLTNMAYKYGLKLLWHKIVCQRDVGKTDLFRPTYSHFLCYSYDGTPGAAFEDVLPVGGKIYENATPYNASEKAAQFIAKQTKKQKKSSKVPYDVVDCFVGQGTIGVSCLNAGLSFLGIDLDKKQCDITKDTLKYIAMGQNKNLMAKA